MSKPPWDFTDEEIERIMDNVSFDEGDLEHLSQLPSTAEMQNDFFVELIQEKLNSFLVVTDEHVKLFRSYCANGNLPLRRRLRVYEGQPEQGLLVKDAQPLLSKEL